MSYRPQDLALLLSIGILLPVNSAPEDAVPLRSIVPRYLGDDLELTVIPWPQEQELADTLLEISAVDLIVLSGYDRKLTLTDADAYLADHFPDAKRARPVKRDKAIPMMIGELGDNSDADRLMKSMGLTPDAAKRERMGDQGYVLFVGSIAKYPRGVVAVLGTGPAGTYFGLQSLRQLTVTRGGKTYIRQGKLTDWPAMPWRGSKRPEAYGLRYKSNFGKLPGVQDEFRVVFGDGVDPQRQPKSWEIAAGTAKSKSRGLDASDAYINWLVSRWREHFERTGQRLFTLKGDDIELSLDAKSGTMTRFGDDHGAAFVHLLSKLNDRLKRIDRRLTLYWMPNPYYTVNWDFARLGRQVRAAGGIPSDVGLWWTGHYVFSPKITVEDIRGYQKAFYGDNPIRTKGFIYDNHGRANDSGGRLDDFFAMPARDPGLAECINGLANERGSAINRITSYDFQWNPAAYDPERSWKLAVRELTFGDVAYWRTVMEFVRTWESGRYPSPKLTTHKEIASQQMAHVAKLKALAARLTREGERAIAEAALSEQVPERDYRIRFHRAMLGNIAAKVKLNDDLAYLWRDSAGPARLIPVTAVPKIDGHLDEACYQAPPTFDRFVTTGGRMIDSSKKKGDPTAVMWEVRSGIVPAELDTQGWLLSDGEQLYLAFRCHDKEYVRDRTQPSRAPTRKEKVDGDYPYCWRQWCIDINLDVKHDRENTFHMIVDPLGQTYDEYLGWPGDAITTGPPWSPGGEMMITRDGPGWSVEMSVPLENLGLKGIKAGEVWGANIYRSGANINSLHSLMKDCGPYGLRYPKMFGQVKWE